MQKERNKDNKSIKKIYKKNKKSFRNSKIIQYGDFNTKAVGK